MAFLVDSDWLIDFLDDKDDAIVLLSAILAEKPSISVITYLEVYQGAAYGENPKESVARLENLVDNSHLLPVTREIARRCADLRHFLLTQGKRVRPRAFDLLIASTALEYELTLVTRNWDDYSDIPNLKIHRGSTP